MATTTPATVPTIPLLHWFLGIALVVMAAVCFGLRYLGIGPMLGHDTFGPVIAYTLSAIDVVLAMVALFVFKPRVPERLSGQSVEQDRSTPEVRGKVVMVWILLEGGGTVAAVGYLITGESLPAIATALTIVAFWLCGPNVFAKT